MITPKASPDKPKELRRRALARLKSRTPGLEKISPEEARNLLQELQIHQVELEMQNDQLRQTQAELEAALTRYTDLYDFAPLAYLTLDERGWVLEANLTAARLLGVGRSRLLQQPLAPFIRPEDIKQFRAYLLAVVQGQAAPPLELNLLREGGAKVTVLLDSLLVPDAAGHPQVRTSLIDITARRRAEESRKNQMHFTETLLETIPSPVFYKDASGRYLGCNRAFEEIWGKRREEVIGKDVYEMGPTEIADRYAEMDQELFERPGSQMYEWQIRAADGSKKEVIFYKASFLDAGGKVGGLVGVILDITERKGAEEALRQSEERFKTVFSEAPLGIALIDSLTGHIYEVNPMFARIAGRTAEQMATIDWMSITHPDDVEEDLDNMALLNAGKIPGFQMEKRYLHPDGAAIWINMTIAPLKVKDKAQPRHLCMIEDITDRKRAEESLAANYEKVRRALSSTVQALSATVETRDPYICGHQRRVAHLAGAIAQEMGFSQEQLEGMQALSLLHDIGKIAVPAEILSKPGKLTKIEFSLIKVHAQSGYDILKDIEFPWPIALPVLQHHERMDGSGYPQGLTGPDIILEARILAVADVVEAMASHRPYRPALGINAALDEIVRNQGTLYDPGVVDVCVKLFTEKTFQFD